jgi:hypothetical protein
MIAFIRMLPRVHYRAVGLSGDVVIVGDCSALLTPGAGWGAAVGPCSAVATAVGSIALQNITSSASGAGAGGAGAAVTAFAVTAFAVARAAARAAALAAGLVPIVGANSGAGSGSGVGRCAMTPTDAAAPAKIDSTCACGFIPTLAGALLGAGTGAEKALADESACAPPVLLLEGPPVALYWCTCEVESGGCSGL